MTLCSRGRSVLVLTLVFGLVTASIIPASISRHFVAERQENTASGPWVEPADFTIASLQRRHLAQIGDDVSQIGLFQPCIISIGHRRLELPSVAANAMGDGVGNFLV